MNATQIIQFDSKTPHPDLPTVFNITPKELHAKQISVKIIDVRRPEEWVGEFGHIANSELITLNTLPTRIQDLPKDQTIVFVCRSGARSAQAAAFAIENGIKYAYNMSGGMIEWTQNSYEVVDRNGG